LLQPVKAPASAGHKETSIALPSAPGCFAINVPALVRVAASYAVSFSTKMAVPAAALSAPVLDERTTLRVLPYIKKLAALRNVELVVRSGDPNAATSSASEPTVTMSFAGPQLNEPAIAPVDIETPGTELEASISFDCTPGETKNAMIFPHYLFYMVSLYGS
jgi:hypothetical protein